MTGYPLSGKSTLALELAKDLGARVFSSGAYARSLGMGMEPSIAERDLSDEFNSRIVDEAIKEALAGSVLDGFPRSTEQVKALRDAGVDFKIVFVIENPAEVFDRIRERAAKDGRPEDNAEVVAARLSRSMEWKRELERVLFPGELLVFTSSWGYNELVNELNVDGGLNEKVDR